MAARAYPAALTLSTCRDARRATTLCQVLLRRTGARGRGYAEGNPPEPIAPVRTGAGRSGGGGSLLLLVIQDPHPSAASAPPALAPRQQSGNRLAAV
jgi:hypothetical protein